MQWTITFERLPANLEEMKSLRQADITKPENTAALTVAALCVYPENKDESIAMLNHLRGPRPLSVYEKQFLADRFRGADYKARSFFAGAVPGNNYTPSQPYTLTFYDNPYSGKDEGYISLYVQSGGADSKRQIKLRNKPSTGEWFLWEEFLLSDIRIPVNRDPWA
ncbi:MAG: hypothetical protein GX628_01475 [Clostridiales bacterium]|nr:hypothetical protein [Clostridiales bacterium]